MHKPFVARGVKAIFYAAAKPFVGADDDKETQYFSDYKLKCRRFAA